MAPKWQMLADTLRAQIEDGTYLPGAALPPMDALVAAGKGSRTTVHQAYRALEAAGYVTMAPRRGTVVRDRTPIRVPLSRYGRVLRPGGTRGPWETATAAQGLDGQMHSTGVATELPPADVASALGLAPDELAVRRSRHATIGDTVVQIQTAWYPQDIAAAAGLDSPEKVVGGVLGAMTAAGVTPRRVDETVTARMPTAKESTVLAIGHGVPVLYVQRITKDRTGRTVEVVEIIGPADRLLLTYDNLPLR